MFRRGTPPEPTTASEYYVRELCKIYGIGPVKAKELAASILRHKYLPDTLVTAKRVKADSLRKILSTHYIDRLPADAKMDLHYNPLDRIPRALIQRMERELTRIFKGSRIRYLIAGSYLRGTQTSGDIDFVLQRFGKRGSVDTWKYFQKTVNAKSRLLHVEDPTSAGEGKVVTVFRVRVPPALRGDPHLVGAMGKNHHVYIKVDTFLTTPESWLFTEFYATGSGYFNIRMRRMCKLQGMLLNQNGLYRLQGEKPIPIKTETQLFAAIGAPYKPPASRAM
jgi:DNA polymerase IV